MASGSLDLISVGCDLVGSVGALCLMVPFFRSGRLRDDYFLLSRGAARVPGSDQSRHVSEAERMAAQAIVLGMHTERRWCWIGAGLVAIAFLGKAVVGLLLIMSTG